MAGQPHMQFYVGDWLKDPSVSSCSLAAKGAWIDLLCYMHELGRGELVGTAKQMARWCRCGEDEVIAAIEELQANFVANVEQIDDSYAITCRRMKKAFDIHQKRVEAGSKGGAKTQSNIKQASDNDNDNDIDTVRTFCSSIQLPVTDADWFFYKCEGNGWTNGGKPIRNWRSVIRAWKAAGYMPSQKQKRDFRSKSPDINQQRREDEYEQWQREKREKKLSTTPAN